jgi:hypothetical protein
LKAAAAFSGPRFGATLEAIPKSECEATVAHILTNDFWSAAGILRRPYVDEDPLAAVRGIMMGTLLSLLVFWMPLAIALTQQ